MMNINVLKIFTLLGAGLLLTPAFGKTGTETASAPEQQKTGALQAAVTQDEAARQYFSDSKLTTQDGNEVRFYTDLLKERVVLIQFIYTHCKEACPLTTQQLADTQKLLGERLGKDIYFLSISVDPERDTPDLLQEFGDKFGAGKGWFFLTGSKQNVELVTRKLGEVAPVAEGHLPIFLLGNVKTGHWLKMQPYTQPSLIAEQLLTLADE